MASAAEFSGDILNIEVCFGPQTRAHPATGFLHQAAALNTVYADDALNDSFSFIYGAGEAK